MVLAHDSHNVALESEEKSVFSLGSPQNELCCDLRFIQKFPGEQEVKGLTHSSRHLWFALSFPLGPPMILAVALWTISCHVTFTLTSASHKAHATHTERYA